MFSDEEETPAPSLRYSIPPAVASTPRPPSVSPRSDLSWIWALATIGVIASAPFLLQHVASVGSPSLGAESEPPVEPTRPDWTALRTVLVREAALGLRADRGSPSGRHSVAVVPRAAVSTVEGRATVFVAEPELHLLVATPVELGAVDGDDQRVLSGLSAGQTVVAEDVASLEKIASRK